jgi:hypothetical protein
MGNTIVKPENILSKDYTIIKETGWGHCTTIICNKCTQYGSGYGNSNSEALMIAKLELVKIHSNNCSGSLNNYYKIYASGVKESCNLHELINKIVRKKIPVAEIVKENGSLESKIINY